MVDFVAESNHIEGILREPHAEEVQAHIDFLALDEVRVSDVEALVNVLQPGAQLRRRSGMDVYVGDYVPTRGGPRVVEDLEGLMIDLEVPNSSSPYALHRRYEALHPFADGNGRSGRAIWMWHMDALGDRSWRYLGFLHAWYYQSLR